jgi:hypothetical protein
VPSSLGSSKSKAQRSFETSTFYTRQKWLQGIMGVDRVSWLDVVILQYNIYSRAPVSADSVTVVHRAPIKKLKIKEINGS